MIAVHKVLKASFERRIRGFRVVEVAGGLTLAALVLLVYAFKAGAGAEGAQIADTTRQIAAEQRRVRALRAELAHLEAPDRLERLAVQYLGLAPVSPRREADAALVTTLPSPQPAAPPVRTTPATATPATGAPRPDHAAILAKAPAGGQR